MSESKWGRGSTAVLDAVTRAGGTGLLVNGDPVRVDILDPDDIEVVSNAPPTTNPSLGQYTYDYEIAPNAKLGVWTARWRSVINGVPITDDDKFEVVLAGSIGFSDGAFATLEEFEVRKGEVDAGDEEMVEALLLDATALIVDAIGTTELEWVLEPSSNSAPAIIKAVCIEVAYRAYSNPDGLAQSTIVDTSVSYVRGRDVSALFLTESERALVTRAAGSSATSGMIPVTLVTPYSGDDVEEIPDL